MKTISQITETATEVAADVFVMSFLLTVSLLVLSIGALVMFVIVRLLFGGA